MATGSEVATTASTETAKAMSVAVGIADPSMVLGSALLIRLTTR